MIDSILDFILIHRAYAPWALFSLLLLAGCNIPISIDLLMVASAVLAATALPEATTALYLTMLAGCACSAWIAYWIGRRLAPKFLDKPWFAKLLPTSRVQRIHRFYQKRGWLTMIVGRFIPFGIRNGIFMTAGISKVPFSRFILQDGVACLLWTTLSFTTYYYLGLNYETLSHHVKTVNLAIFFAFGVTVIAFFWYKKYKNSRYNRKKP